MHIPRCARKRFENINDIRLKEQVITVVGCGGNRDKTKRPIMAGAILLSDKVVLRLIIQEMRIQMLYR
jgi:UDP-N-acetylmuramoyl-L-alanyl-D-glutamate--2,6-diaminopimelate ligase